MTRKLRILKRSATLADDGAVADWALQDAKARFSELVRLALTGGPQYVTVHGRREVVVIAHDEFQRLKREGMGDALVAAMQASPHRDVILESAGSRMPLRDVEL